MTIVERKRMILGAIRKLEAQLVGLGLEAYDGVKSVEERAADREIVEKHLRCAYSCLVLLDEEELAA